MRAARSPIPLVIALVLATTLVPGAAARPVCTPPEQTFNTLEGPSTHDFTCEGFVNTVLVWGQNGPPGAPLAGRAPAAYVACFVETDGAERVCEDACGFLLFDRLSKSTHIRLHVQQSLQPGCPALVGAVGVEFADV